jgi:hypothetical protein
MAMKTTKPVLKHSRQRRRRAKRPASGWQAKPFLDSLQQFLTPQVWKRAHQADATRHRANARWLPARIIFVLLTMTWCGGDSVEERFETGKAFYIACHPKQKRPGKSFQGFHKALKRLPLAGLRALAEGVRHQLAQRFAAQLAPVRGWIPFGCDGSRQECPRTAELEQRLGRLGSKKKKNAAPSIWITALVHLSTGLLWSWRLGTGVADERRHLHLLLRTLPKFALVVCDAGYVGYELFQALLTQRLAFLFRLSSRDWVYVDAACSQKTFREGRVYYWPQYVQDRKGKPIQARLIRVGGKKVDVWLLTNLSRQQLRRKQAERYYRWRWKNEGLFRTYKRTLAKVKLLSRSVRQVHREAEAALLAVQLLLAQGFLAMLPRKNSRETPGVPASPRSVLRAIREEITAGVGTLGPRQRKHYWQRLRQARCEARCRCSPKASRDWPRRKVHKPPKPPKILMLTNAQIRLKTKVLAAA